MSSEHSTRRTGSHGFGEPWTCAAGGRQAYRDKVRPQGGRENALGHKVRPRSGREGALGQVFAALHGNDLAIPDLSGHHLFKSEKAVPTDSMILRSPTHAGRSSFH
jgi:hypothetical protein